MKGEEGDGVLSLPIHQLVRQMQHENGIRHHDYSRYCRFLTRKLARMRKSLGISLNFDIPGTGKSGGRGAASKSRPLNKECFFSAEVVTSSAYLLLPLLYGEYACRGVLLIGMSCIVICL